jgi:ABC-2 type transport system permease protein
MEFEVTVDQQPARAGIDPYNKLIDRNPDDNVITVNKL